MKIASEKSNAMHPFKDPAIHYQLTKEGLDIYLYDKGAPNYHSLYILQTSP